MQVTAQHEVVERIVDLPLAVHEHRLAALGDDAEGQRLDLLLAGRHRLGEAVEGQPGPAAVVAADAGSANGQSGNEVGRTHPVEISVAVTMTPSRNHPRGLLKTLPAPDLALRKPLFSRAVVRIQSPL